MLVKFMKLIVSANISSVSGLKMKMTFQTMQKKMKRNRKEVYVFELSTACVLTPSPQKSPAMNQKSCSSCLTEDMVLASFCKVVSRPVVNQTSKVLRMLALSFSLLPNMGL